MTRPIPTPVLFAAALLAQACTGDIGGPSGTGDIGGPGDPGATSEQPVPGGLPRSDLAATVGLRRLTAQEYDDTVHTLLGHPSRSAVTILPTDLSKPFGNDYVQQHQQISDSLVASVELLAGEIARSLLKDVPRRDQVVGCKPTAPGDAVCLRHFIEDFGRRALRRPLRADEIPIYLGLQSLAVRDGDFYSAVAAIVRTFLQEPEFLYRIEIGTPVDGSPGLFKLNDYEVATRLSYFLWGNTPSDDLLDRAEKGGLSNPGRVRAAAAEMLADPRAVDRIAYFHALWFKYATLNTHPQVPAMQDETRELIKKVVFEDRRPWQDLFRSTETFVTYDLAVIYGLPIPPGFTSASKPTWIPYGQTSKRHGLLSHGTFLSLGAKFGDTSPTVRGKEIRERLFCQRIPSPDEVLGMAVDTDKPPKAPNNSPCKADRYQANRDTSPQCAACHNLTDLVGFGLENYDTQGRYRTVDKDPATNRPLSQCRISGEGKIDGQTFVGPAGLADLLIATPSLNECAVGQIYRFATSRTAMGDADKKFVDAIVSRIGGKDFRFDEVMLDFVSSAAFGYRRADSSLN